MLRKHHLDWQSRIARLQGSANLDLASAVYWKNLDQDVPRRKCIFPPKKNMGWDGHWAGPNLNTIWKPSHSFISEVQIIKFASSVGVWYLRLCILIQFEILFHIETHPDKALTSCMHCSFSDKSLNVFHLVWNDLKPTWKVILKEQS